MPAFLVLFDHILMQNEFERIHLIFQKTARTPPCRMKRAARRVAVAVWKGKKAAGGFSYVEKKTIRS